MALRNLNEGYEESVDLASLVDFDGNPNQGDQGALAESFDTTGWYGALICDVDSRRILAGHTRKRTLLEAGETSAPVLWVRVDDDEHALRVLLGDNRLNRVGWDDPGLLVPHLEALARSVSGLAGTGWDGDDLDALLAEQRAALDGIVLPPRVAPGSRGGPATVTCPECGHEFHPQPLAIS